MYGVSVVDVAIEGVHGFVRKMPVNEVVGTSGFGCWGFWVLRTLFFIWDVFSHGAVVVDGEPVS